MGKVLRLGILVRKLPSHVLIIFKKRKFLITCCFRIRKWGNDNNHFGNMRHMNVWFCLWILCFCVKLNYFNVAHNKVSVTPHLIELKLKKNNCVACDGGNQSDCLHPKYTALQKLRYNLLYCFLLLCMILQLMNLRTWN